MLAAYRKLTLSATLSVALALTIVLALTIGLADPVDAQKRKSKVKRPTQPMTLVVDLRRQRVTGYSGVNKIWSSRISSGKRGHRTPTGVFSIIQKRSRHFSNLYNGAPMPHMQRLTWSGIAFHGGPVPNYPASHGCVRLPYGKARQLFRLTRMSTRTIVTYSSPVPSVIGHQALWNRLPAGEPEPDLNNGDVATKAADAEGATTSTASIVRSAIGISEANAAVTPKTAAAEAEEDGYVGPPRTLAEVRKRQKGQLAGHDDAITLAEERVQTAKALVKAHGNALLKLTTRRRLARRELVSAKRAHKRSTSRTKRVQAALQRLIVRNVSLSAHQSGDTPEVAETASVTNATATATVAAVTPSSADTEKMSADYERLAKRERELEQRLAVFEADERTLRGELRDVETVVEQIEAEQARIKPLLAAARVDLRKLTLALAEAQRERERTEASIKLFERPVHILISRTKSKLYMRQGYKDVYEADVQFAEPDKPIGTHVLSVVDEADDGSTLQWSSLTVPDAKYDGSRRVTKRSRRNRRSRRRQQAPVVTPPRIKLTARRALDRLILTPEVEQRIRETVKVGSSVIISDRGPSYETGKGTDFVVLTR